MSILKNAVSVFVTLLMAACATQHHARSKPSLHVATDTSITEDNMQTSSNPSSGTPAIAPTNTHQTPVYRSAGGSIIVLDQPLRLDLPFKQMHHPLSMQERITKDPFFAPGKMFLGSLTHQYPQEALDQTHKAMMACYAVIGRGPAQKFVQTMPDQHPHPLLVMLRDLEVYAGFIEFDWVDKPHQKYHLDDPIQKRAFDQRKRGEHCYQELYLTIWALGMTEAWRPKEPLNLQFNGFYAQIDGYVQRMADYTIEGLKMGRGISEPMRDLENDTFGSQDKFAEAKIRYYDQLVNQLLKGE